MAKWGEGDPRWIVEERSDATNVNNWHWTEKDTISWTKEYLEKSLLRCRAEDDDFGHVYIDKAKVQGDSTVGSRKGKIYSIYDLELDLSWKGRRRDEEGEVEGTLLLKDVTHDFDLTDALVTVTTSDRADASEFKSFIKHKILPVIEQFVAKFAEEMRSRHVDTTLLPVQGMKQDTKIETRIKNITSSVGNATAPAATGATTGTNKSNGTQNHYTEVVLDIDFIAEPAELFECFTVKQKIMAWSRGEVNMSMERAQKGSEIVLFGGSIYIQYTTIDSPDRLVLRWRSKEWSEKEWSTVELTFKASEKTDNRVALRLRHSQVPKQDAERIRGNWYLQFFNPIRAIFGYGNLF